jgi:enoyl-CoA hydratase/carnithine racemase
MASAESAAAGSGQVTVDLDDLLVATVTFSRPPDNYFDVELLRSVADAFESLDDPSRCRAIVLRSEGRNFCAGARLERAPSGGDGGRIYDEALRLFNTATPVVAACQGAAIGGGLGLALAADFRIGAGSSRFSANFSRLGFHPGFGISLTLPRAVGAQHAARLLYTGERIDGVRAREIGLLDDLVANDEIVPRAQSFAREIAGAAPLAVRSIRQTLRGNLAGEVEAILRRERSEQGRLMKTEDFREGVAATAERRSPEFRGH